MKLRIAAILLSLVAIASVGALNVANAGSEPYVPVDCVAAGHCVAIPEEERAQMGNPAAAPAETAKPSPVIEEQPPPVEAAPVTAVEPTRKTAPAKPSPVVVVDSCG